jgi:hypothetical protein
MATIDRSDLDTNMHYDAPENGSSLPEVAVENISGVANKLYSWLGSFWSVVYEDRSFIQYVQGARALRIAQLYLDILEAAMLVDRSNAPVFHRERWHPIVVRRSGRNTGSSTMLKLGAKDEAILGTQSSEIYPDDTKFRLGGRDVSFKDMVVYRLDPSIKNIATCIVDNIAEPRTVLHSGTDYAVLDGAIALRSEFDPFGKDSTFATFEIVADDPRDNDVESVMWACDTLVDKDYVYGHLGYAIGLPTESTEGFKRIVNAVWNTVADGATPRLVKALVAAICDVPTIRNEVETVETILSTDDGGYQVITDKEVYTLPRYSKLHPKVHAGTMMHRFDLVDDSIRVYPYVMDVDRIDGYTEFGDKFESDVPAIDLPPALFRTSLDDGFSVGWAKRPIVCSGFDANGNPKLGFRMDGSSEDNEAFWADVWDSYEKAGTSIETCFGDSIYDRVYAPGKTCGSIVPIRFFLRQLIGANTLVITVRTDVVGDDAPLYDPKFFQTVRECIPSYVRLFFIEHESVGLDGDGDDEDLSGAREEDDEYAYEESFDDERLDARSGFRSRDRVTSAKWVARCRDKDSYDDID